MMTRRARSDSTSERSSATRRSASSTRSASARSRASGGDARGSTTRAVDARSRAAVAIGKQLGSRFGSAKTSAGAGIASREPLGSRSGSAKARSRAASAARSRRGSPKNDVAKRPSVDEVVAKLKKLGSKRWRDGLARFAIPSDHAIGVPVGKLRAYAKVLGRDHALSIALWKTGWLEARMLSAFVDDPVRVTSAQMDRWCRDFDNWAVVDTACFHLFDRTVEAWKMVERWADRSKEFEKRAAFALLWSLSVHDKQSSDAPFLHGLRLIEREARDERNFVKKAVNMALRAVGKRSFDLNAAAIDVARRLARSENATARWNGKDALRELESDSVRRRLAAKRAR